MTELRKNCGGMLAGGCSNMVDSGVIAVAWLGIVTLDWVGCWIAALAVWLLDALVGALPPLHPRSNVTEYCCELLERFLLFVAIVEEEDSWMGVLEGSDEIRCCLGCRILPSCGKNSTVSETRSPLVVGMWTL